MQEKDEKYGEAQIEATTPGARRLENFWYYNKGKVIIGFFVLLMLTILIVQSIGRAESDAVVVYGGSAYLSTEQVAAIEDVLGTIAGSDAEKKKITVVNYLIFSGEEITAYNAQTDENGKNERLDTAYNAEQKETFDQFSYTGESSVYFVSDFLYKQLSSGERLTALSDVFGNSLPASAYGADSIRLGDTAFYQYYKALQVLPADTRVVLMRPYIFGASSKEENYNAAKDLFRAIAEFVSPQ